VAAEIHPDMKLLVTLTIAACVAIAAPIGDTPPPDNTPLCGYVRMEEDAWWSVGLQTYGHCMPIWNNETALIYRIDRDGCGCAFFPYVKAAPPVHVADGRRRNEETCKGQDDLVLHRGPKLEESRFMEEEKPAWVLCQTVQG
jgi:hypothetical protein